MKYILKTFFLLVAFFLVTPFVNAQDESGRWYVYDNVKVDLNIFKNSEVEITEKYTYEFHGVYKGVFREITLNSDADRIRCQNDPELQCGGFDRLELLGVYDNEGQLLPEGTYKVEEVYNETYQENRLNITWMFAPDGRNFEGEKFDFGLKYKVYKSIGSFEDYDLLYWNALFPDRTVDINSSEVNIIFPDKINFKEADLNVLAGDYAGYDYDYEYYPQENRLSLTTQTLYAGQDFTILYKIPKGLIDQPPKLKIDDKGHETKLKFYESGDLLDYNEGLVELNNAGKHQIKVQAFGYKRQNLDLDLKSGEVRNVEVDLEPTLFGIIIYYSFIILNCLGLLAIPSAITLVYMHWRKNGRDKGKQRSIYPIFEPPNDIKSYMLGSIKDEKVHMVDITSVIIDLAYKGYIKIKELGKKGLFTSVKYEFVKLKDTSDLTPAEKKITDALFKSGDTVNTDELKNKFYSYIPAIQNLVYDEMTDAKYFEANPQTVRGNYAIKGVLIIVLGIGIVIVSAVFLLAVHYLLGFITLFGISVFIYGLGNLIIANFMPAKTEFGREIFEQILGFRMFLYHAERYKLQNLTPDMFERYLSYAVVFGIEKEWGQAFRDIYKGKPDWYESSNPDFNSIFLANALSNMMMTTSTTLASSPSSSSSHSGGGWSGGGGFSGGFSGGGGGGGGGGAF